MPIQALTPEEEAQIADPLSLPGRAGQTLVNAPSDIFNDLTRLYYNLGVALPGDSPVAVPKPYDIPPPQTTGESLVDIGGALGRALPLIMTGEGATEGLAEIAGAAPTAAKILGMAGGFGLQGLTDSPEAGAEQAALGGAFRAADFLPLKYKIPLATAIGLATGADSFRRDENATKAVGVGAVNAVLPFIFKGNTKLLKDTPLAEPIVDPFADNPLSGDRVKPTIRHSPFIEIPETKPTPPGIPPSWFQLDSERGGIPPAGSLVEQPTFTADEALRKANPPPTFRLDSGEELPNLLTRTERPPPSRPTVNDRLLPFETLSAPPGSLVRIPPEGSLVEQATFSEREAKIAARGTPNTPPGSLVRDPTFSPEEAKAYAQSKKPDLLAPPPAPPPEAPKLINFNGKNYATMDEAIADTMKDVKANRDAIDNAPLTKNEVLNPSRELTDNTVLHTSDTEMLQKATKKLNLRYDGPQEVPGRPADLTLTVLQEGRHTTLSPKEGITFGELKASLKAKMRDYDAGEKAALPKKVATLQPEVAPLKAIEPPTVTPPPTKVATLQLKAEVKGNNVTIGGKAYGIIKEDGVWYHENVKLGTTKQAAVKQLKLLHASPSPSLENANPGYKAEDKVLVDFGDGWERGTISSPAPAGGDIHQVRLADGSIVDVRDAKVKPLVVQKYEVTRDAEIRNVGLMEDFRKLEEDNQDKVVGMKLRQKLPGRASEEGAIPVDVAVMMGRYIAAPILVGAPLGAVLSEPDHRLSGAIKGAIIVGAATIFGPKIFRYLAEGHVDINKPGTYPAAVKHVSTTYGKVAVEVAKGTVLKAAKAEVEKAITKASIDGSASQADKTLLWLSKHFTTNLAATRIIMKSKGPVDVLSETLYKAISGLSRMQEKLSPDEKVLIGDYLEGKVDQLTLEGKLKNPELSQYVTLASQSRTALQRIVTSGMKEGALKKSIEESFDKYLTTSYKLFTDKHYFPTDEQITKVAMELKDQATPLEERIRIVRQDFAELKANRAYFHAGRSGQSVSSVLFRKDDITKIYQDALGVYDDPIHKLIATTTKLVPIARSSAYFNEVAMATRKDGLKYVYGRQEMGATLEKLRQQEAAAKVNGDFGKVATLQKQISELKAYKWSEPNEAHGKLGDVFLDRRMHDHLSQHDALAEVMNGWTGRHLRKATTVFKYSKTVLSPLQLMRQIWNVPFLGYMSGTGFPSWAKAAKSLYDPVARERLTRLGVASGDIVSGLLSHDLNHLLNGNMEKLSMNNPLLSGLHKWENLWRTPDLIVRVAAFQKEESRLLEMGLNAAEAETKAIDFTNRYTMNYEVIPPGVRMLSNVPFVNQFLTWTFEIARITKNVAMDALGKGPSGKVDLYAAGKLAALGGAPFALQAASEASLSAKDRADWNKVKTLLPDYARSNFLIVWGRDAKGHFNYTNFTGLVIHDNYLKMLRDVLHGDGSALMADNPIVGWENTPLLNIARNQMSGKDIHTGQPVHSFSERLSSVRRDFAPPLLGTDFDKFVDALTPNADGGLGISDIRTGQSTSLAGMFVSYVTATRGYSTDLNFLERKALATATADVNDQRVALSQLLRSNARPDVKQRAIEQFKFVQKQIFMALREQLQIQTPTQ